MSMTTAKPAPVAKIPMKDLRKFTPKPGHQPPLACTFVTNHHPAMYPTDFILVEFAHGKFAEYQIVCVYLEKNLDMSVQCVLSS